VKTDLPEEKNPKGRRERKEKVPEDRAEVSSKYCLRLIISSDSEDSERPQRRNRGDIEDGEERERPAEGERPEREEGDEVERSGD